jgi:hypothetical protein
MSYTPVVYFISTEYLRTNTPIEANVDDTKLTPYIIQAQDTYLQEGIGETFYDRLKDGVANNNLNADEQAFMRNFVQPQIAQYAFYLAMPFIAFKATNKSVSKESSEYSAPAELNELKFLRNNVLDIAEFYKRRMIKYLLDHPSMFPQYNNPNSRDNMPKSIQSYFGGLYVPYGYHRGLAPNYLEPYGTISPCVGCGGYIGGYNGTNPY